MRVPYNPFIEAYSQGARSRSSPLVTVSSADAVNKPHCNQITVSSVATSTRTVQAYPKKIADSSKMFPCSRGLFTESTDIDLARSNASDGGPCERTVHEGRNYSKTATRQVGCVTHYYCYEGATLHLFQTIHLGL